MKHPFKAFGSLSTPWSIFCFVIVEHQFCPCHRAQSLTLHNQTTPKNTKQDRMYSPRKCTSEDTGSAGNQHFWLHRGLPTGTCIPRGRSSTGHGMFSGGGMGGSKHQLWQIPFWVVARWAGRAVMSEENPSEHCMLPPLFLVIIQTWLETVLATRWTNKHRPLVHVMFSGHCSSLELLRLTDPSCQGWLKNTFEANLRILEVLGQRSLLPGILSKDCSHCSYVIPLLRKWACHTISFWRDEQHK